jgi:hypothetical protein
MHAYMRFFLREAAEEKIGMRHNKKGVTMNEMKRQIIRWRAALMLVAALCILLTVAGSHALAVNEQSVKRMSPREVRIIDPFSLRMVLVSGEPIGRDVTSSAVILSPRPTIRIPWRRPPRSAFRPIW